MLQIRRVRQPDQDHFFDSPGCGQARYRPARRARMPGRSSAACCSAETSSSTRRRRSLSPPSRPRSIPARRPSRRAGVGVLPASIAGRCSDDGSCPDRGRQGTPGSLLPAGDQEIPLDLAIAGCPGEAGHPLPLVITPLPGHGGRSAWCAGQGVPAQASRAFDGDPFRAAWAQARIVP